MSHTLSFARYATDLKNSYTYFDSEKKIKMLQVLNRTFATLAKKYNGVKFVSIRSTDGDKDFDPIALPTVNIYKDKAIITCLTRVGVYVCNEDITKHIEGLLAEYEVFGLSQ